MVARARVSPDSLASLKNLMANYQEAILHTVGNPVPRFLDDVESMLSGVTTALSAYLTDVLEPIVTALKYCVQIHFL